MKCSNCQNFILILRECNLCLEKLCSEECIISHNQIFHQPNLEESHIDNSINNNSFLNYAKEESHISSPFLVKGIMNYDYITYDPIYSPDNFTLIYSDGVPKSIGNGSFGQVFLAVNNIDQKIYAIKHMEKEKLIKYLNTLSPIYAEIDIQSRVNHPNIVKLLYVRETELTFDLVMDYAKDGTLFDYVVKKKGLPEKEAFKYFIQIVNAIKFLHDNDVIHRDIKPENILLFDNEVAKLCDFGWSIKCENRLPGGTFTGTTEYMAPELINNMDYGKEIDIWMLGILLYELMHGFSPFRPKKSKFEDNEVVHNIQTHNINFYKPVSDDCKELIFSLLETDVNKRCKIDGIYTSKFVKNFEKEENDYSSHFEIDETENIETNNRITNSNINSNSNYETKNESDLLKISKSQLLNRYTENDELNDSKKVVSPGKNYEFINIKKIDSDNLSNYNIEKNENIILNNHKDIMDNSLDIDDPYEDEPNAPKNNKRNRLKKKQNINNPITKLNLNFNNENLINSVNKKEEDYKNTISNSPKNNNKKRKNLKNDLNLDLNSNTILNNNVLTSRRYKEQDKQKDILDISESHSIKKSIKRSVLVGNNNHNHQQVKNEITNYIFNNNKDVNMKPKILTKKLISNTNMNNINNKILSLSLSPGTAEYESLLSRSISPGKPYAHSKEKNNFQNHNKFNFPVDVSDNWSNTSQSIREYPFDHFVSNSSLDIRKPTSNNRRNTNIEDENEEQYVYVFKEKEPNDNMRRKNKFKKEDIPRDNIIKNNLNKNINPKDNNKKNETLLDNNLNNKKQSNFEKKTTNSAINETVNLSTLNYVNPISKTIIKKISENLPTSKSISIRNYSVSTTDDLRSKRQNSNDIKNSCNKNENKEKINKEKPKDLNNENSNDIILSNNLKVNYSPKSMKTDNNEKKEKHLPLKKTENKNKSFIAKNKNQMIFGNSNDNGNKNTERRQKFYDKKREKKGGSVNKYFRNFSKFNKNINEKKRKISYKNININKNKINKQKVTTSENSVNINREIIKNEENEKKQEVITDNIENKKNQIMENKNIINKDNKEKIKNENVTENTEKEKNNKNLKIDVNKEQKIEIKEEKENIEDNKKNITEKEKEKEKIEDKKEENKNEKTENKNKNIDIKKEVNSEDKIKEIKKIKEVEKKDKNVIKEEKKNEVIKKDNNKPNISMTKESIKPEKEKESRKSKNSIIKIRNDSKEKEKKIPKNNAYREIIDTKESKQNNNKDNKDSIQNTKSNQKNNILNNSNKKSAIKLSKRNIPPKNILNIDNNKEETKQEEEKINKMEINEKENKIIKTIEKENEENESKDQIKKIFKKTERKYSREKRYTKVKIDPPKIDEKSKNLKLSNKVNLSNSSNSKNNLPRKVNTKSSQNEQLNDSSVYEYKIGQNKEEKKKKSSYNIKTNNSNSETKTTNYSKKHIYNLKDKIKNISSVINTDEININFKKSKSPDTRKQFAFKNKLQKKEDLIIKNDEKNNNNNNRQQIKNKIDNKNENKENIEINKRLNGKKNINKNNEKEIEIVNMNVQNKDLIKKTKKKYRKFKLDENLKEENEHSEKYNNDSESYIIDGDSEYGDSEVF